MAKTEEQLEEAIDQFFMGQKLVSGFYGHGKLIIKQEDDNGHRQTSQEVQGNPAQAPGAGSRGAKTITLFVPFTHPAPEPLEDAGIRAGEVRAWRCWSLTGDGRLRSIAMAEVWEPGEPMTAQRHWPWAWWQLVGSPLDNAGGVHAWKTRKAAEDYMRYTSGIVVGEVALWGEIIEHENGYRAEFGEIVSLDWSWDAGTCRLIPELRETYGVGGESLTWWHCWGRYIARFVLLYISMVIGVYSLGEIILAVLK